MHRRKLRGVGIELYFHKKGDAAPAFVVMDISSAYPDIIADCLACGEDFIVPWTCKAQLEVLETLSSGQFGYDYEWMDFTQKEGQLTAYSWRDSTLSSGYATLPGTEKALLETFTEALFGDDEDEED